MPRYIVVLKPKVLRAENNGKSILEIATTFAWLCKYDETSQAYRSIAEGEAADMKSLLTDLEARRKAE